ncbi:MAG: hemolysin family protein [Candidatus Manganitrophus sp.]|nr:hemolysin family protein [Candidatus Manganitrophus sp.]WDT71203.1 MAG: hemolysin family protein [Candidatus Manganitrophus sp.]WDT76546.1 MAG: hemolysin family protein [Candidatus Manganitrophus sp.]
MTLELTLIIILILINAFFSAAEIAVITARKSNIKSLSEKGNTRAGILYHLQSEPERFLATVQIGVTLVGSAAAAVGGVVAVESIRPFFEKIPLLNRFSEAASIAVVVLVISYLTLILGELVPKSLSLKYPEQIALAFAKPLDLMARVLGPFVRVLTTSVRFVLKPIGGKVIPGTFISEEEIKYLLKEGREKGVFNQTEQELIHSVFEFNDISVKEVMVPRPKIHAVQIDTPFQEILKYVTENKFSRYPVYRTNINDITGILYFKDLMSALIQEKAVHLKDLLHPAYFVPETMQVSHLLKELQRRRIQMAIVINEYGSVEGLVTMEDLVEEIVGEIQDEYDVEDRPVERLKDGSWVIDASLSVRDLNTDYGLPIPESANYETLGGFALSQLQNMPKGGEIIRYGDYKFTIVDMDGRRIAKLKVEKKPDTTQPQNGGTLGPPRSTVPHKVSIDK